jgi:transcriptional regulator with XRE-family HTH domain
MWLETLKELKKEKHMSAKQIAEKANMSERTVSRIFSGDTDAPYVDTLQRIAAALDASLDDILGDSKAVVGSKNLATLQEEVDRLTAENEMLTAKNTVLESKVTSLSSEIDILRLKLEHKEEIIALHNMYGSVIGGLAKGQTKKPGKE